MKNLVKTFISPALLASAFLIVFIATSCNNSDKSKQTVDIETKIIKTEAPEYFLLRPEVEKAYGYSHAVKIGNDLKISGAVSMDDKGNLTAAGSMEQQMKNC